MKGKSLDEVVARLAKESLSRRRRSTEKARRILTGARPEGQETSTFPPIRHGPMPEVSVKFRVHFAPAKRVSETTIKRNRLAPALRKAQIWRAVRTQARAWEVPAGLCAVGG
jgi:hypothetical protein